VNDRSFGAEDALAISPSSSAEEAAGAPTRCGILSEEGWQTVASAIVSTLLETDFELAWKINNNKDRRRAPGKKDNAEGSGMGILLLMEEVRARWLREEGVATEAPPPKPKPTDSRAKNPYAKSSSQDEESQSQFGTTPSSQLSPPATTTTQSATTPQMPPHLVDEVIWHRATRPGRGRGARCARLLPRTSRSVVARRRRGGRAMHVRGRDSSMTGTGDLQNHLIQFIYI
jgi:hypothetical protein